MLGDGEPQGYRRRDHGVPRWDIREGGGHQRQRGKGLMFEVDPASVILLAILAGFGLGAIMTKMALWAIEETPEG